MGEKDYTIRIRFWIDEAEGPFLGTGRIILLEKIKEKGSITNAAKSMKMSYRKAWQLIEDMNKRAKHPLVEKILGGKNGGGAKLTKAGEEAIEQFHKMENEIKLIIKEKAKQMHF